MSIVPSNASQVPYDDNEQEESLRDPTIMPDQMHMDCYILPPDHSLTDVLGEKHSMLDEFRQDTGASLKYNASMYQVDIWGEKASVNRAKQHLHQIVERLDEKAEPNRRRTEKWSKPERKVKTWEKRRVDRKAAQQAAQQIYQGYPDAPQPYNDTAEPRNDEVPLTKLLDTRDAFLDQIRASCKCWVYVDTNNDNIIHIAGQEKDRVIMARTRIRNWYSLNARLHRPYRAVLHLMKQPRNYMLVKYRRLPKGFVTYRYATGSAQQMMLSYHRLLEPISINTYEDSTNLANLDAPITSFTSSATEEEDTNSNLLESLQDMDDENAEKIRHALEHGLENIRLFDWQIRMKLRFGQMCLINYPRIDDTIQVDKLALETFNNPEFHTRSKWTSLHWRHLTIQSSIWN